MVSQFEDFDRGVHFEIFLIIDFQEIIINPILIKKITNSISKILNFYIIFVYFITFFLSDFIKSQHLVKVNALTLTFEFSLSNHFLKFLKYIL